MQRNVTQDIKRVLKMYFEWPWFVRLALGLKGLSLWLALLGSGLLEISASPLHNSTAELVTADFANFTGPSALHRPPMQISESGPISK